MNKPAKTRSTITRAAVRELARTELRTVAGGGTDPTKPLQPFQPQPGTGKTSHPNHNATRLRLA